MTNLTPTQIIVTPRDPYTATVIVLYESPCDEPAHTRYIGRHRFEYRGGPRGRVAWSRWLDRCAAAYRIRQMMRGGGK